MVTITKHTEKPPSYYDQVYSTKLNYTTGLYEWVVNTLISYHAKSPILDVGCGIGKASTLAWLKAKLLIHGLDFSQVAVDLAKRNCPNAQFFLSDVREFNGYNNYKTFIMSEVLEHLEDDLEIIEKLPKDSMIILTVPCTNHKSHVRYFVSLQDVVNYYCNNMVIKLAESLRRDKDVQWGLVGIKK